MLPEEIAGFIGKSIDTIACEVEKGRENAPANGSTQTHQIVFHAPL